MQGTKGEQQGKPETAKGKDDGSYRPLQVPKIQNLLPVYVASAGDVDRYLDPALCAQPLPFLATTIAVLSASEASPYLPDSAK